jgi:hypothetical protein
MEDNFLPMVKQNIIHAICSYGCEKIIFLENQTLFLFLPGVPD